MDGQVHRQADALRVPCLSHLPLGAHLLVVVGAIVVFAVKLSAAGRAVPAVFAELLKAPACAPPSSSTSICKHSGRDEYFDFDADLGMRDTTGKFFVTAMLRGYNMFAIPSGQMADDPRRTHPESDGPEGCGHYREEPCDGPAVAPFEPEDSYCPVGQTCDVACAKGFAGFDAAMNCKNANVGYCCK